MKKHSLDQYIGLLLHDDHALQAFLADPTNGGAEHGISKAERAVLRRTVAHLSNVSRNGYGVQRDLGSYRRSLRLLQNVLHQHAGAHQYAQPEVAETGLATFFVYIPKYSDINTAYENPSQAYTTYVSFQGISGSTLGEAMNFDTSTGKPKQPFSGKDASGASVQIDYTAIEIDGDWYLETFTITGGPNAGTYTFNYADVTNRLPFWFYSLDGAAIVTNNQNIYQRNPKADFGNAGTAFDSYPLNGAQTVYWQAIAPDTTYGFAPCFPNTQTSHQLGTSYPQSCQGVTKGETFYTNSVSNILIDSSADRWILSSSPDGTGNISTDDVVKIDIELVNTSQKVSLFEYDYSEGCIGKITPLEPVDITSSLAKYSGEYVNIYITYQDQCGGCISSTAYYLVAITETT